jgi:hypothetical protein
MPDTYHTAGHRAGTATSTSTETGTTSRAAQIPSPTVRSRLPRGSDIMLEDRGTHPLKGVQGSWQLFAVVNR